MTIITLPCPVPFFLSRGSKYIKQYKPPLSPLLEASHENDPYIHKTSGSGWFSEESRLVHEDFHYYKFLTVMGPWKPKSLSQPYWGSCS